MSQRHRVSSGLFSVFLGVMFLFLSYGMRSLTFLNVQIPNMGSELQNIHIATNNELSNLLSLLNGMAFFIGVCCMVNGIFYISLSLLNTTANDRSSSSLTTYKQSTKRTTIIKKPQQPIVEILLNKDAQPTLRY